MNNQPGDGRVSGVPAAREVSGDQLRLLYDEVRGLRQTVATSLEKDLLADVNTLVRRFDAAISRALSMAVGQDLPMVAPVPVGRHSPPDRDAAHRSKLVELREATSIVTGLLERRLDPIGQRETALARVERLCERFHLVAGELARPRRRGIKTRRVVDEYDVQSVIGALLRLDFDDVRPEEAVPSCAGAASRIDFLVEPFGIAIEAKMARPGLTDKRLGEELLTDIGRYQAHPRCRTLCCLVHDPGHLIASPRGLESDLSRRHGALAVRVFIRP